MTTTRRNAEARGNTFRTIRQAERDVWNLHDVFLTALLMRSQMEGSPIDRTSGFEGIKRFFASDRGRLERLYVAFLFVLVEAWLSRSMGGARALVNEASPDNGIVSMIRDLKKSGALDRMCTRTGLVQERQHLTKAIKHMLYCRFLKCVLLNFVSNVGQRCRYLYAYVL